MSTLVVRGGRDLTGAPTTITAADGVITGQSPAAHPRADEVLDATGLTVAPGLLDLQVNGAAGIDVTAEPERLWEVAAALPRFGVTAFVPTVITAAPQVRSRAIAVLADGPPGEDPGSWSGAVPLGLHFEGPMISPERVGAHPPRWLAEPSLELVADWSRDAGVLMATLAPELPGALEVIGTLSDRGVLVSVGHTEADAALVAAAVAAGARMLTHLGNAMPPMASRAPGPVGAALGGDDLVAGVITDGHHLDALTVNAAWRGLGPTRFLTVTDATAALGLGEGPARLGEQDVMVANGTVRLADGTLAGSAASLSHCLRFLRRATGCSLAEAIQTCTATPAALLDDPTRGVLRIGGRADLTLLDGDLNVAATVVGGRVAYRRPR
ncbi:MAG: N-acetylglucosamine-6-phosphate deacetylase [Nocardioides sp.]|uniref:N-acetylglucosamine-6-phosphate deacetylase n=1 Tax=Nocardioides sp. TaxID=35761 RepID=UPI0039E6B528